MSTRLLESRLVTRRSFPLGGRCGRTLLRFSAVFTIALNVALVTAACGDAKPRSRMTGVAPGAAEQRSSAPQPSANAYQAGLAYAACMRAHAVHSAT